MSKSLGEIKQQREISVQGSGDEADPRVLLYYIHSGKRGSISGL